VINKYHAELIESSFEKSFSMLGLINNSLKFPSYYFDDFFLKKHQIPVFLPHFTMFYNLEHQEKMVLEVSTICMNMCEFSNLLLSIGWVSSWLLHACCLTFSIQHPWRSVLWSLDELYINNWFFYFIKNYKSVHVPKTTRNTLLAIEWFLKQLVEIKFKNNFKLYFDDVSAYFNVWNIVLRHNWTNEDLMKKMEHFKRHISRSFTIKSRKYKGFRHEVNMFTLTDIRLCFEIQRETSLLLKNTKLWLWNWMITSFVFNLIVLQSRYFKNLIFENCIIMIPNVACPQSQFDFKIIEFREWWFICEIENSEWNYGLNEDEIFTQDLNSIYYQTAEQKWLIEILLKSKILNENVALIMLTKFQKKAQTSVEVDSIRFINCDFGDSSGDTEEDSDYLENTTMDIVFSIDEKYVNSNLFIKVIGSGKQ
jgi:hypothetical protein